MTLRRPQATAVAAVAGVLRGADTVLAPGTRAGRNVRTPAGNGLRVTAAGQSRLGGVRLRSLPASGVREDGVDAFRTDDPEGGAAAEHNSRQGIGVRHAVRYPGVVGNRFTADSGGVLVVGEEEVPRAGGRTVSDDIVAAKPTCCPSTARLPFTQGAGTVLTGAERTLVVRNRVVDHHGTSPMSGGIVLFRSVEGAHDAGNTVRGDTTPGDSPADPADRDQGTADVLRGNTCRVFEPKGLCEE
ncbi:hypothetical protein [Actinacidiphila sp. bgisy167]|uniref:hypothetical protein n=1 Tax=Actinacidiphila sp. bgisy167 TaxID=3413797 RepID=UPI003D728853